MLQFINLETGNIYDGTQPYIHWFPGQQSTGLIYVMPMCIITDDTKGLTIKLESDVFSLSNAPSFGEDDNINGIVYKNLDTLKTDTLTAIFRSFPPIRPNKTILPYVTYGENNKYKILLFYVIASSKVAAEFIDTLYINDIPYNIGVDFYNEDESLYINLSNFGVEIPESVQRAIYPVNIHEENKDNITLNRKFKELLSNYWDVIANKGSYKSLLNSLKWFEWSDIVRVREIWKHEDFGKTIYDDRALCSVLEDKYKDSLSKFAKTTYIALYAAMQKLKIIDNNYSYDDEKNPELEAISSLWSRADLMLKMCLLGHFYETYFMPIHLDLIHSTIEDVVFTNTIKVLNSSAIEREDIWFNTEQAVDCNVKDNDVFYLSNVSAQVSQNTLFGNQWDSSKLSYEDMADNILGVETDVDVLGTDNDLKTFYSQLFDGVGAIVKFICRIKLDPEDYIIREQLTTNRGKEDWVTAVNNDIFPRDVHGYTTIIFNLLCRYESNYDVRLQFNSAGGRVYTHNVKFDVIDISNASLSVYKIQHEKQITVDMWYRNGANDYIFSRVKTNSSLPNLYTQYIPAYNAYTLGNINNHDGVCLNNVLILTDGTDKDFATDARIGDWLVENYFITHKTVTNNDNTIKYTIGVSKRFNFTPALSLNITSQIYLRRYVYRSDYIYFPEFHKLVELEGNRLEDYIVYDYDALAIVPTLSQKIDKYSNDTIKFSFGKNINSYEWEFENVSTGEIIKLDKSISEPNIANSTKKYLSNGYYNISFKYTLIGDPNEHILRLNSAFIKK